MNALGEMGQLGKNLGDFLLIFALPVGGPASWEGDGGRKQETAGSCSALRFMRGKGSLPAGSLRLQFWSRSCGSFQGSSSVCQVTIRKGRRWQVVVLSLVSPLAWGGGS